MIRASIEHFEICRGGEALLYFSIFYDSAFESEAICLVWACGDVPVAREVLLNIIHIE